MKFRVDDLVMYQGHLYLVSAEPSEEYPTYEITSYPYGRAVHDVDEEDLQKPQTTRFILTVEAFMPKAWARDLGFHPHLFLKHSVFSLGTTTQQEDLPDRELYVEDLSPFIGREFEPDTNDEF